MSASAVRGGQVYVEIGANPNKFLAALSSINTRVADVGDTLRSAGIGMSALGAAIAGPILGIGAAFVEQTAEMQAMNAALKDVGNAVGEAVAPAFVGLANVVAGAARAVAKFVRDNQPLVRMVVAVGGYLMAWGAALTVVGSGMSMLSRGIAYSIGPIGQFAAGLKSALVAFGAFAASGPVLAAVAVLAGIGVGAVAAGADLRKLAGAIGGAFANPVKNLQAVFGDLLATTNLTIEGMYRAIAAGDLGGAVDVLWAGFQAAWARGEQAVMGSLDPWIEGVQNVFFDLGIGIVAMWDQAWTNLATSDWGGYVLGALDNYVNAVLATWDFLIGNIQKGWAMMWNAIGRTSDQEMAKEIARIDAANAGNAAERDRIRPGFAGRTNLSDEQKARMQKESLDRQNAMFDEADRLRRERADRTRQNVVDRQAAVDAANRNLQDQVNRFPVPSAVQQGSAQMASSVVGQFGGAGLEQMGASSIPKQQLDELKRIREELAKAAASGGIVV
jgi:hypothetical protein